MPAAKRAAPRKSSTRTRIERDTMGEMSVPADALFGASTQRAVLNFPVSGRSVPTEVIEAFAELKRACAGVNGELGVIPKKVARSVMTACDTLQAGLRGEGERPADWWEGQFPVDVFQTGSGTSTNMNVNEVLSNLAALEAGNRLGSRDPVHPNDHVNQGQSSNDTFPTAMQIAGAVTIRESLIPSLKRLASGLRKKARKWDRVVKTGRTHLQDATPMRVGQEFSGFAAQIEHGTTRAERAMKRLAEQPADRRHRHRYRESTRIADFGRPGLCVGSPSGFGVRLHRSEESLRGSGDSRLRGRGLGRTSNHRDRVFPRSPTTFAGWDPVPVAVWENWCCPRPSPAPRSCPGRSTRSSAKV